jgi:hypothetical protein
LFSSPSSISWGWGQWGEMNQSLYAHMNNKRKMKKNKNKKKKFYLFPGGSYYYVWRISSQSICILFFILFLVVCVYEAAGN